MAQQAREFELELECRKCKDGAIGGIKSLAAAHVSMAMHCIINTSTCDQILFGGKHTYIVLRISIMAIANIKLYVVRSLQQQLQQ